MELLLLYHSPGKALLTMQILPPPPKWITPSHTCKVNKYQTHFIDRKTEKHHKEPDCKVNSVSDCQLFCTHSWGQVSKRAHFPFRHINNSQMLANAQHPPCLTLLKKSGPKFASQALTKTLALVSWPKSHTGRPKNGTQKFWLWSLSLTLWQQCFWKRNSKTAGEMDYSVWVLE